MASSTMRSSHDSLRPVVTELASFPSQPAGMDEEDVEKNADDKHASSSSSSMNNEKKQRDNVEVLAKAGLSQEGPDGGVKRRLKSRHLTMVALAGTIGTGLYVGLGSALSTAGPLSTLLGYSIMGFFIWALMIVLGEMATYIPAPGGFVHHASRFVDEGLAFSLGWIYWGSYGITLPTELQASALVVSFWDPEGKINPAVWITILMVLVITVNVFGVRVFGEVEFWFASCKIVTIVILIIVMLVLDVGGGPNGGYIGGRYYNEPGAMAQLFWTADANNNPIGGISGPWGRFLAFWKVFVSAAFSFAGVEILGVTVGEVVNPRRNVPKAIKQVALRIIVFYVLAVLLVGLVVPYNDPRLLSDSNNASASPFVIAIESAGIKVLPHIVNAVLIIVTWSAAQSDLYASSRTLYGLALEGQAPKFLKKCTKSGNPIYATLVTSLWAPLGYMGISSAGAATVFQDFYDLSAVSILLAWWAILFTYIRFYKGIQAFGGRDQLPYRAPLQPYLTYIAIVFISLVILFSAFDAFIKQEGESFDTVTFVVNYLCVPLFFLLWFGYKFIRKTKFVRVADMDFETGRRALDEEDGVNAGVEVKRPKSKAFLSRLIGILF